MVGVGGTGVLVRVAVAVAGTDVLVTVVLVAVAGTNVFVAVAGTDVFVAVAGTEVFVTAGVGVDVLVRVTVGVLVSGGRQITGACVELNGSGGRWLLAPSVFSATLEDTPPAKSLALLSVSVALPAEPPGFRS